MKNLINQNIKWIIHAFDPNSKKENAIHYCAKWLIHHGNQDIEFKKITDDYIVFDSDDGDIKIKYYWNEEKWKWEFKEI